MNEAILVVILLLILASGMFLQKFIPRRTKTIIQLIAAIIMLLLVWIGGLFKENLALRITFSLLVLINMVYVFWKCRNSTANQN